MTDKLKGLIERRVPQVLAIYAGASWGFVEFVAFAVDEFLLSPHWTRVALAAVLTLVPSVFMLAWFHGRPGRDDVPLAEKIGIPLNLAILGAILVAGFGGADLGVATMSVSVETEGGETVERVVVKPEFRKRVVLFPFDAGGGLEENDAWARYAAPLALEMDLVRDDFVDLVGFGVFNRRFSKRGLADLRDLPLPLKREISKELYAAFFAGGEIHRIGDGYRVRWTLFETGSGSRVSENVHEGPDLLALVDEMSEAVRNALEIPARETVEEVPVRELLTANGAAWEEFGRGFESMVVEDFEDSISRLEAATSLDPTFALAQYALSQALAANNQIDEAVGPMRAALNHLYRVPERVRFKIRSGYYFMTGQMTKAWSVLDLWVERHPWDLVALRPYARAQETRGDWWGLLRTLETLYRLNPKNHLILSRIAEAHGKLGDDDKALAVQTEYVERSPDDPSGRVRLADILRRRGEHDGAREQLEIAIGMAPLRSEPVTALASLDASIGRFEDALAGHERALALARSPAQRADALGGLKEYHVFRGETESAVRASNAWLAEVSVFMTPFEIAQRQFDDIQFFYNAGRDDAVGLFETPKEQLRPPLSDCLIPLWEIHAALAAEDEEAARAAYQRAVRAINANEFGSLLPALIRNLGRIDELAGDYQSAVRNYREAMALDSHLSLHGQTGAALRKAGRLEEAESELKEALRISPADPRAHLELALILRARGDVARAGEHLHGALATWEFADESFGPARVARVALGG